MYIDNLKVATHNETIDSILVSLQNKSDRTEMEDQVLYLIEAFMKDASQIDESTRDEFKEAVENGWIDEETAKKAKDTLLELIRMIDEGKFPPQFVRQFEASHTKCYPQDWFSVAKKIINPRVHLLDGTDLGSLKDLKLKV